MKGADEMREKLEEMLFGADYEDDFDDVEYHDDKKRKLLVAS